MFWSQIEFWMNLSKVSIHGCLCYPWMNSLWRYLQFTSTGTCRLEQISLYYSKILQRTRKSCYLHFMPSNQPSKLQNFWFHSVLCIMFFLPNFEGLFEEPPMTSRTYSIIALWRWRCLLVCLLVAFWSKIPKYHKKILWEQKIMFVRKKNFGNFLDQHLRKKRHNIMYHTLTLINCQMVLPYDFFLKNFFWKFFFGKSFPQKKS